MECRPLKAFGAASVAVFLLTPAAKTNPAAESASSVRERHIGSAALTNAALRSGAPKKSTGRFEWNGNTYSWYGELIIGDPEPGLEPEPEPEFTIMHGPAVHESAGKVVSVTMTCPMVLSDDDGYLNNFTIAHHLKDPGGNEVSPTPPPAYTTSKPSLTSNKSWTLTDPDEGVYTCKPDLYVYSYYLGTPAYPQTLSYLMPTGETSSFVTFDLFLGRFTGHLTGAATFSGRVLHEADGGNRVDTCHYPGSPVDPYPGIPPSTWDSPITVNTNGEYTDNIGMGPDVIDCYRGQGDNCHIPVVNAEHTCQMETDQRMYVNRPGASPGDQVYKTNRIKKGIGLTWIWSERDGQPGSTPW